MTVILIGYGIKVFILASTAVFLQAIFAHLGETWMGVWPNITLWRYFFVLKRDKWAAKENPFLGKLSFI